MLGLVSMHMPFSTPKKGKKRKRIANLIKMTETYDIINSRGNPINIYIYIYI